jgi:hypothetical protein
MTWKPASDVCAKMKAWENTPLGERVIAMGLDRKLVTCRNPIDCSPREHIAIKINDDEFVLLKILFPAEHEVWRISGKNN